MTVDYAYWKPQHFRYSHTYTKEKLVCNKLNLNDYLEFIDCLLWKNPEKLADLLNKKNVEVFNFSLTPSSIDNESIIENIQTLIHQKKIIAFKTTVVKRKKPFKVAFRIQSFVKDEDLNDNVHDTRSYKKPLCTLVVKAQPLKRQYDG